MAPLGGVKEVLLIPMRGIRAVRGLNLGSTDLDLNLSPIRCFYFLVGSPIRFELDLKTETIQ